MCACTSCMYSLLVGEELRDNTKSCMTTQTQLQRGLCPYLYRLNLIYTKRRLSWPAKPKITKKNLFPQETRFILHSLQHYLWLLLLRRLLFWRHRTNDVRVPRIRNTENWHTEVLAASCSQFDVIASVMMDSSLGQHGIVLNLTFPVNRHEENYHYE